ncbi:ubiquitin carboxyl-terminal hydrolase-like protein 10 [Bimuria novae-zelandiae CBS 107.79]|uniref:Ubiquitin carboxyl-terminal hydrolase n=1 Tax=Bimuria novae-zelandiae CBS 107.79 TaxID=1447943 RepID=A0A6A5UHS8_9PLEO|nr:ubiquitin carboxyl-terminal hydrolase-like protein 10 [Bimuria novae-zelandiae CBS 107.79]
MQPAGPFHPGRRHGEHQYHQPPPQAHSPVHYNPYAANPHPHFNPHASPYPPPPQQQQWYAMSPYVQPQHHQYAMPPRQFQPHGSPVVVSSHPHMAHLPPVNRAMGQTPPVAHSHTPPAPRIPTPQRTPQPVPSTPSVHSQQALVSSPTPPTTLATSTPPPTTPSVTSVSLGSAPIQAGTYEPYHPPLPWLSVPDVDFPPRASQKKRRRRGPVPAQEDALALPSRGQVPDVPDLKEAPEEADHTSTEEPEESQASTVAPASEVETDTPQTSHPPSERESTLSSPPPSSAMPVQPPRAPQGSHARTQTKPAVPLIPIKPARAPSLTSTTQKSAKSTTVDREENKMEVTEPAASAPETNGSTEDPPKASPLPKAAPGSWAALLRSKNPAPAPKASPTSNGIATTNGPVAPKSNSLGDVLASYSVDSAKELSFLEPRGLVNTGNLCYMNSILQVLLFCVPFYDFLDQYAKRVVHSFKSETPLVDAMIMFMRDFKVIDSAESAEKLRMRLKDNELEQYGEPLTPEYVYDVIRRLPRFDNMKRGQQEDAEEFLGFLLAGFHDECAHVIKSSRSSNGKNAVTSPQSEQSESVDDGWLEVGPKQKASVTQSSGAVDVETPLIKIFGGKIRSEYKRPGEKSSITMEPYQPLQLDIHSPDVNNITDALKALTHLETLDSATRGGRASTKQMFIETLPPVLILHLKRFHYDANGPQKIWKKIGYPLELDIPKEVFPPHKRGGLNVRGGSPRYRLTAVVYHHGKNASGGHYTVDVRRQEGREWIRMDDTIIRRIRAEDVAEGGAEEDPKVLAAALEQHKSDTAAGNSQNFYENIGDNAESDRGGWSQVNGSEKKEKKWAGVVNGTATPNSAGKRTPLPKDNVRDNKVAYILFYQRMES